MSFAALMPASAATPEIKFEGTGSARALDLSVPGLARLAPAAAALLPSLTVGATSANFSSKPSAQGMAAGVCNLLSKGVDPLGACSFGSMEQSVVPGADGLAGDQNSTCKDVSVAVVTLSTACGKSVSSIISGPASINEAGVAEVKVNLDLAALGLPLNGSTAAKDLLVTNVGGLVNQVFTLATTVEDTANLSQNPLTADKLPALNSAVEDLLRAVSVADQAAVIKVGNSSTIVDSVGTVSTITSKAAAARIGLLGLTDALEDGLVIIEVSSAMATAKWDSVAGIASSHAEPALASIKVKDILDLVPGDYLGIVVNVDQLNSVLGTLTQATPLLATEIKASDVTKDQTGKSVFASASGVEIHALKGLGASSVGAADGGLSLRLAATQVAIAGDVAPNGAPVQNPPMPLTGGPTPLFILGALILAGGAFGAFRFSRKLSGAVA